MSKSSNTQQNQPGPNKAKSIVAQPLFRCRQERPAKGKGSYRREAFPSDHGEAYSFMAA
jgi:alternative ribosome-rescue factor